MLLGLMQQTARDPAPPALARETAALRPAVRAVIASMLREAPSHPDVDDATNESLRRALEHPDRLHDAINCRAYVLGIARHVALDVIRSRLSTLSTAKRIFSVAWARSASLKPERAWRHFLR